MVVVNVDRVYKLCQSKDFEKNMNYLPIGQSAECGMSTKEWKKKIRWMKYQPKSNEKCTPFLHCIWSFEGTYYNNL